jgi:hypothetical protein
MLKKYRTNIKSSGLIWSATPTEMEVAVSEDTWDSDESHLMQAWDEG